MPRKLLTTLFLLLIVGRLQAADGPRKLVLIGDSTVKNGQGRGDGGLWGWGQVLQPHFDAERLVVENRALGGRSSRTYLTEGLWQRSLDSLRVGDFVLMQFGHNDGGKMFDSDRPRASIKGNGDESRDGVVEATGKEETVQSYGWYLRRYVADAKAKGAIPIVLSPVPRNIWRDGKVARAGNDYGQWAKEAAEQAGAAFVDLNEIIAARYEKDGQEKVVGEYFTTKDHTHTTRPGAVVNAACMVEGLLGLEGYDFESLLKERMAERPSVFHFGGDHAEEGVALDTTLDYNASRGYGFEAGSEAPFAEGGVGACRFSVAAAPGNYLVEATLGSPVSAAETAIEAELRRSMTGPVQTAAGESVVRRFLVNVRSPALESGGVVRLKERERTTEAAAWDGKLTLTVVGDRAALSRLEIRPVNGAPTVYLLGDSTVADQPAAPWASWGQKLPRWFDERVAVANHSESGETVRGSWNARRFNKVLELIRPGDWLLIQFGHNDMKSTDPGALDRYRDGLRKAVVMAQRSGATPVLVTSMERKAGVEHDTLGEYPQAVRDLAAELEVAVVDLHRASKRVYRDLGDRLPDAFQDGTHHTDLGADLLAAAVVEGLRTAAPGLASYLTPPAP